MRILIYSSFRDLNYVVLWQIYPENPYIFYQFVSTQTACKAGNVCIHLNPDVFLACYMHCSHWRFGQSMNYWRWITCHCSGQISQSLRKEIPNYLQKWRYRHCWSKQYAGRVSNELHNRPRSPLSLCGSVVEHWKAESEGLRFDSSWGLFPLSYARDKTKKYLSLFLYRAYNLPCLLFYLISIYFSILETRQLKVEGS